MKEFDGLGDEDPININNLNAEVDRLAKLSLLDYERARTAAAKRLKVRAAFLDRLVEKARPTTSEAGDDTEVVETLEPWPDPVDGASLADEIRDRLRVHVVFGNAADADALTLWIIGTYLMPVWRLWPKILIESPTKRCGKTTLLEVIEALVFRAMVSSNVTAPVLFRCIHKFQPTLLVDEADRFLRDKDELNGIINAGHTKRGAYVLRCVGDDNEVTRFAVWCPQVFAGIGKQADTLIDRSLVISLRRKLPTDNVERLPFDLHDRMLRVRRQIARWAADNKIKLGASETEPPDCGNDRRRDNFTPLYRIAEALGGTWPDRVATAYAVTASDDDDDEPAGVMLLRDLANIFSARSASRLTSADLVVELVNLEERPWSEWRHGRPLTAQSIAKLLRPFEVRPRNSKAMGGQVLKTYFREDVDAAFARYAATQPPPSYRPENKEENADASRYRKQAGSGFSAEESKQNQPGSGEAARSAEFERKNDPTDPEAW